MISFLKCPILILLFVFTQQSLFLLELSTYASSVLFKYFHFFLRLYFCCLKMSLSLCEITFQVSNFQDKLQNRFYLEVKLVFSGWNLVVLKELKTMNWEVEFWGQFFHFEGHFHNQIRQGIFWFDHNFSWLWFKEELILPPKMPQFTSHSQNAKNFTGFNCFARSILEFIVGKCFNFENAMIWDHYEW